MIGMHEEQIVSAALLNTHEKWNATYNKTNRWLTESGDSISPGLAKRLAHYARKRLTDDGWGEAIAKCSVSIDAWCQYHSDRPQDQTYVVNFTNAAGGIMGVQGIFINRGWPHLDHGVFLES